MYVYSTKKTPNVPQFTDDWSVVKIIKDQGQLAIVKKVYDVAEGTAYLAERFANFSTPTEPVAKKEGTPEKWCATTQSLTIYRNDKGFFTRRCKKVNDEWKTLFIPVYFSDGVTPPESEKNRLAVEMHWTVTGNEVLKLVIVVDKIHNEGDLPF